MWMWVECPCPPVRNDIVTPRLFFSSTVVFLSLCPSFVCPIFCRVCCLINDKIDVIFIDSLFWPSVSLSVYCIGHAKKYNVAYTFSRVLRPTLSVHRLLGQLVGPLFTFSASLSFMSKLLLPN